MNNNTLSESSDFFTELSSSSLNSFLLGNACSKDSYINKELSHFKTTDKDLIYIRSWFIEKYFKRIKSKARYYVLQEEERSMYYCDPKRLSYDKFGSTIYWYVILALNNMSHPTEFRDLSKILIPDITELEKIVEEEENNSKKLNN